MELGAFRKQKVGAVSDMLLVRLTAAKVCVPIELVIPPRLVDGGLFFRLLLIMRRLGTPVEKLCFSVLQEGRCN